MRSSVLFFLLLSSALVQAQFEKAEASVRAALAKDAPYKAITLAERALTKKDAPPVFHVLRADGLIRVGKYDQARYHVEQARAALGTTAAFRSQLIGIYLGQGKLDSALALVEEPSAVASDPEHLFRCGSVLRNKNEVAKALAYFDTGVRAYPDNARMLRERGTCYALAGDSAKARADLDKCIALAPRDAVNYNSRGYYGHQIHGDFAGAKADFSRAIKQDPNYGYAFSNRGWCEYKLGSVEKARKDLGLAVRKNPGNAYPHRSLGIIALDAGDKVTACAHWRKAQELGFTAFHGHEVDELVATHCEQGLPTEVKPTMPAPVAPPANAPGGAPPKRSNAP